MKQLYFVRHGETIWNNLKLAQGSRNDISLNDIGKEQSYYTGKYLHEYQQLNTNFDLVIVSPMVRAIETAHIICKEIGYDINNIVILDELKEVDHGLLAIGKTINEMKLDKKYNDYFDILDKINQIGDPIETQLQWNKFNNDKKIAKKYEYELFKDLKKRCMRVIEFIKKCDKNKILIVTHNGTIIFGFISLLFNIDHIYQDLKYGSNCHITYVEYKKNKFNLVCIPNTRHFKLYNKSYKK